jgi:hypothetical protein
MLIRGERRHRGGFCLTTFEMGVCNVGARDVARSEVLERRIFEEKKAHRGIVVKS